MAGVDLRDGRAVVLRTAGPDDVPAIAALFTRLSPGVRPQPVQRRMLARAAGSPGRLAPPGTVSIVVAPADDPGHLAAEARYVPAGPDVAELALAVLDSYQGTGLGHLLLGEVIERACGSGADPAAGGGQPHQWPDAASA